MSRVARRAFAITLCVAVPRVGDAQDVRELSRRFELAIARRDSASRLLDAARVARASTQGYPDTVAIVDGAVLILTNPAARATAHEAATTVDAFLRARFGNRLSLIPQLAVSVRSDTTGRDRHLRMGKLNHGREENAQYLAEDATVLAYAIEVYAQQRAAESRPMLMRWLTVPLPTSAATNETWRTARLELASSITAIARRCYAADLGACKAYLGLTTESDPATAWYDSSARHTLVANAGAAGHLDVAPMRRCVAGRDAECIALMRNSPALAVWSEPQGTSQLRTTLVQQALADGGPGSLGTLLERNDAVGVALSAAAKVPVDSLVAHWQRHVHDGGATSDAFSTGIVLVSVGWIVAFGGIATRSSRWR